MAYVSKLNQMEYCSMGSDAIQILLSMNLVDVYPFLYGFCFIT